jgi:teichuronic acid biosynthesis glycosyltransferase TuaC
MRILTFTSLFPNALRRELGIFVYQRVSNVARLTGKAVRVIAPVPFFPSWLPVHRWRAYSRIPQGEQIGGIEISHPRYPLLPAICMPLHGLLMFLGSVVRARRIYRTFRFDCIDAHYVYPDGFAAVLLGKLLKVPVVVSARGTDINIFPSFPLIRPMLRWTLRRAAGRIAVSSALKDCIVQLGIAERDIRVVPNGVDTDRFRPVNRREARRKLGLPQEGLLILCVGSLTAGKRHSLLIQALTETVKHLSNVKAYLIGEGPLRSKLQTLISDLGMDDRVFLAGEKPNEELYLWFSAADVSCLVSSREGWPNVVMESMACGTPVVATRVGGIPEIVTSPELGILVDEDAQSVADGLCEALERLWDRRALVRYAESRTWQVVAQEVLDYMESCVRTAGYPPNAPRRINESNS